jgi:hypothetical protein
VYAWGCFYLSTGIDVVGHSVPSKIPDWGPASKIEHQQMIDLVSSFECARSAVLG